jgi:phosphoglycerate dehydrogenase-like enzyme
MRVVVFLANETAAFSASEAQVERLRKCCPQHEFVRVERESDFLQALPNADVAVVWSFEPTWYACSEKLKLVATPAAGRERVSVDATGRVRASFGSFHGRMMAESLLAMMLFMNRRFGDAMDAQQRHVWDRTPYLETRRLSGQVALLVGFGAIARHAATLLTAVGMRVHGVKRDVTRDVQGLERVFGVEELRTALAGGDHIACILPAESATDDLIGAAEFACMKPTAHVYNLGRGNAIDAEALEHALRTRRIAGAFLDVVKLEPLPESAGLWDVPNLYLTPHASAVYAEYIDLYFEELAGKLSEL